VVYLRALLPSLLYLTLLLLLSDRCRVYQYNQPRLFGQHRSLFWCLSALAPALLIAAFLAYLKSMPVGLKYRPEARYPCVELYPCTYLTCRGSALLTHAHRVPDDMRL
ncbi:uncharacterized protein LOC101858004, partial [Aplysia californica]|uniref:Uncharacterized protein LOC101858004 n=1 Tax=Aplysia californica TaxID=6500 RepID=A0ABM1AFI6_APLCA